MPSQPSSKALREIALAEELLAGGYTDEARSSQELTVDKDTEFQYEEGAAMLGIPTTRRTTERNSKGWANSLAQIENPAIVNM